MQPVFPLAGILEGKTAHRERQLHTQPLQSSSNGGHDVEALDKNPQRHHEL